jgi:hypothetical protein
MRVPQAEREPRTHPQRERRAQGQSSRHWLALIDLSETRERLADFGAHRHPAGVTSTSQLKTCRPLRAPLLRLGLISDGFQIVGLGKKHRKTLVDGRIVFCQPGKFALNAPMGF